MPAFDPHQFIDTATALATPGADEAAFRTAIGRLYYALFLLAREKLGVTTTLQVHGAVVRVLTRRRKATGDQLFALLNLRLQADYELQTETDQTWPNRWLRAQRIANALLPVLERLP